MKSGSSREVYVSIDVETDGPCPGMNSMLALGAAAFGGEGEELGTWYGRFFPSRTAEPSPETMHWWKTQPEAWAEVNRDRDLASRGIPAFATWLDGLAALGKPVAVALPAAFDFAWVNYYLHAFAGRNPLGYSCLDIRSYAMGLDCAITEFGLTEEEIWKLAGDVDVSGLKDHVAVDDAVRQGRLFMALRASSQKRL